MLVVQCPRSTCARKLSVPDTAAGNVARCPHCGQAFRLAPPPAAPRTTPEMLDAPAVTLTDQGLVPTAVQTVSPAAAAAASPGATLTVPPTDTATGPAPTLTDQASSVKSAAETLSMAPAPITGIALPPGALALPSADEPLPPRIGRFEVRERLGEGAFGVVYRAHDPQLDREVALKVAKPQMLNTEDRVKRFLREARAAANLRHPHIVPVHDSGRDGDYYYIASAFIRGRSLAAALEERTEGKGLTVPQAAEVVRKVAEALAYAHGNGVIHRDVKPANIMLDEQGEPLLMDFGLAARAEGDEKLTQEATAMGTPAYMAPEQAAGQAQAASDQYSLGCTLYELLTGQTPFSGPPELQIFLHQTQDAPPPSRVKPQLPRDLETICLKALARDPAQRYAGLQLMAGDLQRFAAGEPILARREGLGRKVWRKARRNRALTLSVVGFLLLLGGVIVWANHKTHAVAAVRRQIDAGLQAPQINAAYLDDMEQHIHDLERLDPDQAGGVRTELYDRFAKTVRDSFDPNKKPILSTADQTQIESALALLRERAPSLEPAVRKDYEGRLARAETHSLTAPFANLSTFFDPSQVQPAGKELILPVIQGKPPEPLLRTRLDCRGNIEMEVEFVGWEGAAALGLVLNALADRRSGYTFRLGIPPMVDDDGAIVKVPPAISLGAALQKAGFLRLEIERNGVRQREDKVRVGTGPLRLRVTRQRDELTVQVNQETVIHFRDAFPASTRDAGVFALLWPAGVRVARLQVWRQATPAAPSPLEQGDILYARGEVRAAMEFYHSQGLTVRSAEDQEEARCKEGRCLMDLQSLDEAARILEPIATRGSTRWRPWAACQLWAIRLLQNKPAEAGAIFATLEQSYSREQLAVFVSSELRQAIWKAHNLNNQGVNLLKFVGHPERARQYAQAVAIEDLLDDGSFGTTQIKYTLSKAFRCAACNEDASRVLADLSVAYPYHPGFLEEYAWLMHESGRVREARDLVNRRLLDPKGEIDDRFAYLLLARARLHAAEQQWAEAEKDVVELLRRKRTSYLMYYHHAPACLLLGFLRERAGDAPGAMAAWREGLYGNWVRIHHPEDATLTKTENYLRGGGNMQLLHGLILASLTNELKDEEGEVVLLRLLATASADSPLAFLKSSQPQQPALLRSMWQSKRGRDIARRIAFEDLSYAEVVRAPLLVLAYEGLQRGALPGDLSADQDAVVWKLAEDLFAGVVSGKLGKAEALKLALAWKGVSGAFGWKGVSDSLDPSVRGPLGYVLAQRYERVLKTPDEAPGLYRDALKDAAADSPLRRLVEAELERLKNK